MGFQKSTPSSAQLTIRVPIYDSAGLPRALEAIDTLAGAKSLNHDQKQYLEAISILTHGHERDSD